MSKEHLVMWKAIEKGWTASDLKRVNKKIHELYKDFNCSIPFGDVYGLALMLDEPVDYKLEWSLIRLCKDGIIDIFKKDDLYMLDLIDFKQPKTKEKKKKNDRQTNSSRDIEQFGY